MNVRRLVHGVMLFIAVISIMALSIFQGAAIKDYESIKHCYQQVGNIPCKLPSLKEYKPYCIYPPAITNKSNGTENPMIDTYTNTKQTFENNFARFVKQYTLLRVEFLRRTSENCGDDSVTEQLKEYGKLNEVKKYFGIIQSCYQNLQECQTALIYNDHIKLTRYDLGSLNADLFTTANYNKYREIHFYERHYAGADIVALRAVIDAMLYTIFNLSNMCIHYDQKLRGENVKDEQLLNLDLSIFGILREYIIPADASPETRADDLRAGNDNKDEISRELYLMMLQRYKFELKLKVK